MRSEWAMELIGLWGAVYIVTSCLENCWAILRGVDRGGMQEGGYSMLKLVGENMFHSFKWTEQQWRHGRPTPIYSLLGLASLPSLNQVQLQSYSSLRVALSHQ